MWGRSEFNLMYNVLASAEIGGIIHTNRFIVDTLEAVDAFCHLQYALLGYP